MLQKAKIYIRTTSGTKEYQCSFNPSEYTIRYSAEYKENQSIGSQKEAVTFVYSNLREFSTTLYFTSKVDYTQLYQDGALDNTAPVTDLTGPIVGAMAIDGHSHKPAEVAFVWGNLNFSGVFASITETVTMFASSGKPVRSKLDVTIKENVDSTLNKKGTPLFSPDRSKSATFAQGMSLWALAYQEYGDPELWRLIAKANHIKNPLHVQVGQVLKIPAL